LGKRGTHIDGIETEKHGRVGGRLCIITFLVAMLKTALFMLHIDYYSE